MVPSGVNAAALLFLLVGIGNFHQICIHDRSYFQSHLSMSLEEKYPEFFQFLASYLPDSDYDDVPDEEIVAICSSENPKELCQQALKELQALMGEPSLWQEVSIESNRFFHSEQEIGQWLRMIFKTLDYQLSKLP